MSEVNLRSELARLLADAPRGSLSDLARVLGVTSSAVSSWKRGVSAPTDRPRLNGINAYLELPERYLVQVLEGAEPDQGVLPTWQVPGATPPIPITPENVEKLSDFILGDALPDIEALREHIEHAIQDADYDRAATLIKTSGEYLASLSKLLELSMSQYFDLDPSDLTAARERIEARVEALEAARLADENFATAADGPDAPVDEPPIKKRRMPPDL